MPCNRLTFKQRAFVEAFGSGMSAAEAARQAGYKDENASAKGARLMKHPRIKAEIDGMHAQRRERTQYDAEAAFAEAGKIMEFAIAKGNPAAAGKMAEHRAKLCGLLIERQEITSYTPDIRAVLTEAQARLVPMRSPVIAHDAEFTDISKTCESGTRDNQSLADHPAALPAPGTS